MPKPEEEGEAGYPAGAGVSARAAALLPWLPLCCPAGRVVQMATLASHLPAPCPNPPTAGVPPLRAAHNLLNPARRQLRGSGCAVRGGGRCGSAAMHRVAARQGQRRPPCRFTQPVLPLLRRAAAETSRCMRRRALPLGPTESAAALRQTAHQPRAGRGPGAAEPAPCEPLHACPSLTLNPAPTPKSKVKAACHT